MKRSGWRAIDLGVAAPARARIAWCIVGTAVYQVGLASSIQPKNLSALKPGVQKTWPPAESGASTPAIRPWMWNSGMMFRPTSVGRERERGARCCGPRRDRLRCESGTIFGREVVPEVCRTSAMSSALGEPPFAAAASGAPAARGSSWKLPAVRAGVDDQVDDRGRRAARATSIAGEVARRARRSAALAFRSVR